MIYMGVTALTWEILAQAWLKTRLPAEASVLEPLINNTFGPVVQFVILDMHPKMEISKNSYMTSLLMLLAGLIPKSDANKSLPSDHLERLFTFSLFWCLGSLLELDERKKLQVFMLEKLPLLKYPKLDPASQDTFFEYFVSESGEWMHWRERVPQYEYPRDSSPEFSSIIIPTVDNVRSEFLMDSIAKQGRSVLLIGEPGTAKTVTISRYIAKMNPELHLSKNMNFSSATTPNIYQRTVESYLDKRMGTTYGPPAGKKMTIFVDDVNMPAINEWGDMVTAEILRQNIEQQGFYSLDRPGEWSSVVDLQFLAAMMHPGGGRNDIPARLKRQFFILNCTIPSETSVDKIFGTMLCGHFCAERKFVPEVVSIVAKLPSLTRRLWQATKTKMLPTPAKFHYIFNLRDLSRITEGMMKVTAEAIPNAKLLINLWEHECSRVLPDRFTNQEDIDWFHKTLVSFAQKEFGDEMAQAVSTRSFFVDFMRDPPEQEDPEQEVNLAAIKVYEKVPSFDVLKERLMDFMRLYNESIRGAKMDLVLFEDAMKHIVRISRIIRTPRGNALLVGVGGSGKQSLTKLSSYIAGNQTFQIAISKNYNTTNLMEDLKNLYKIAGIKGNPVTFIFTDNEVKEESFLGYINNILTSGEVTNLFAKDEIISIASDMRAPMKKARPNVLDTIENMWKFFIDRVKDNLHVVLCFSPVGDKFRTRALKFPGLIRYARFFSPIFIFLV
jgi:dynein heavy chain